MSGRQIADGAHQVTAYINTALLTIVIFMLKSMYGQTIETANKVERHEVQIQVNSNNFSNLKESFTLHLADDERQFGKITQK